MKRFILIALIAILPLAFVSCASTYHAASKPNKEGKVVVIGLKQIPVLFVATQRAWLVDVNTGEKTPLEVEFE